MARRSWRSPLRQLAGGAGVTLACAVLGASALGAGLTLAVAPHATVTPFGGSPQHAAIVVSSSGRAVYELSGDTVRHPKCTSSACLAIWPPVTVRSAHGLRTARGIHGKLGVWRHGHLLQLVFAGHPLYTFAGDTAKRAANGQDIKSFGGTWHVLMPNGRPLSTTAAAQSPAPSPSPTPSPSPSPNPAPSPSPAPSCGSLYCY